ncbi:MAG: DUF2306 domain-containing protein [Anaerolineales bacterium]|nr:DUF2306 domain-containing protein [Anaerolineales bacterium]
MTAETAPKTKPTTWLTLAGLLLLSTVPLIFGALRLQALATGTPLTPNDARFFASPLPVIIHIVSAAGYALAGAFQFVTGYRRRWFGWHRAAGRVLTVGGLLVALSGLWMTLFYLPSPNSGGLVYAVRLVFGSGMVVSLWLGFDAILRRRAVLDHRAWMLRAYALAMGAGTQVLTGIVESLLVGQQTELSRALALGAGWIINLAVAEWAIRRLPAQRARTTAANALALKAER